MVHGRLNDASIALNKILQRADVRYGIFGIYAIAVLGGQCENKDIDCVASVTKEQILNIMDGNSGFVAVPQTRHDYVFFCGPTSRIDRRLFWIMLFHEPRADKYRQHQRHVVILDPIYLFKGTLRAAAQRSQFRHSADLRWLESRFSQQIRARSHELNLEFIGAAIKRHAELELLFNRIGVDVNAAKYAARNLDVNYLQPLAQGVYRRDYLDRRVEI